MWKKVKLILSSIRQYKKYAVITPLFMIGEALLECIMPFTMSMLIDSVNNAVKNNIKFTFTSPIPYVNQNLGMNLNVTILQKQISQELNKYQSDYSDYETGKVELDYEKIVYLCKRYKITPNDLFDFE